MTANPASHGLERRILNDLLQYTFLTLLTLFFLYPLLWMAFSSFKTGPDIASTPLSFNLSAATLDNYRSLLRNVPLYLGFQNTLIVLIFKGALNLIFAPLAGFAFANF